MAHSKQIGILVGGGDVPGLNMCLKSLVYRAIEEGFEPIGVRKGWEGLINYNYHDPTTYTNNFIELTKGMVRPIDRTSGSFLHASRINPTGVPYRMVPDFLRERGKQDTYDLNDHIKEAVDRLGFRGLIALGDDDMLRHAARLSQMGVPIIGIPKTIHNIFGTAYTVGFSTGLARSVAYIHELRALAGSREQIVVVEMFRVNSGLSTLLAGFLAGALGHHSGGSLRSGATGLPVTARQGVEPQQLCRSPGQRRLPNGAGKNGKICVATVAAQQIRVLQLKAEAEALEAEVEAEAAGALDEAAPVRRSLAGSGMIIAELMEYLLGEEVFMQPLTYLLRTGPPDGQDLLGAANFAIRAVKLLSAGSFGRMTAYQQRYNLTDVPLTMVLEGVNGVDVDEMYNVDEYKPKVNLIWAAHDV